MSSLIRAYYMRLKEKAVAYIARDTGLFMRDSQEDCHIACSSDRLFEGRAGRAIRAMRWGVWGAVLQVRS
jgi:hypothetical protein